MEVVEVEVETEAIVASATEERRMGSRDLPSRGGETSNAADAAKAAEAVGKKAAAAASAAVAVETVEVGDAPSADAAAATADARGRCGLAS